MPVEPGPLNWIRHTALGGEEILSYAMRLFFEAHPGVEEKEQSVAETLRDFATFWDELFRKNAPSYITTIQSGIGIVLQDGHQICIVAAQQPSLPDEQAVQIIHP